MYIECETVLQCPTLEEQEETHSWLEGHFSVVHSQPTFLQHKHRVWCNLWLWMPSLLTIKWPGQEWSRTTDVGRPPKPWPLALWSDGMCVHISESRATALNEKKPLSWERTGPQRASSVIPSTASSENLEFGYSLVSHICFNKVKSTFHNQRVYNGQILRRGCW